MTETTEGTEPISSLSESKEKEAIPEAVRSLFGMTDEDINKIRRLLVSIKGGNPDAQQTITDFMDMKDPVEGSNLPNRRDVQLEIYLDICGKFLFPDIPDDPFTILRNSIALTFKAKGGEKAKQFVEMVRNTTDLSALTSMPDEVKQGIFSRFMGRGKE